MATATARQMANSAFSTGRRVSCPTLALCEETGFAGEQQQPRWHVLEGMPQGRNILANENIFIGTARLSFRSGITNTGLLTDMPGPAATARWHLFSWQGASAYAAWGMSGACTLLLRSSPTCKICCWGWGGTVRNATCPRRATAQQPRRPSVVSGVRYMAELGRAEPDKTETCACRGQVVELLPRCRFCRALSMLFCPALGPPDVPAAELVPWDCAAWLAAPFCGICCGMCWPGNWPGF